MAVKGNQAIAVDRDAIECYCIYTKVLAGSLNTIRDNMFGAVKYLSDEDNVSGGDTDEFRLSLETLNNSLVAMQKKIDIVEKTMDALGKAYGVSAAVGTRSLKEAREEMAKSLIKVKSLNSNS